MTSDHALGPNDTLADIRNLLADPRAYVTGVFHNHHDANRKHPGAIMRLGRTGEGKMPHYRFDLMSPGLTLGDDIPPPVFTLIETPFNGRNHKPLIDYEEASDTLRDEHWSQGWMDLEAVKALLREVAPSK